MIQKMFPTHGLKYIVKVLRLIALRTHMLSRKLDTISLLGAEEKKILNKNKDLKDKHKGQRAFVIVNGPSLKHQDIEWLKDEVTIVVSGFFKHEVVKKWQPTYYSIIDKAFFNGSKESDAFFELLRASIKSSTFLIPLYAGYKANQKHNLLPHERTYYFATSGLPNLNIDMTGVVQAFTSVSSFSLAQAIYMGCNPIYLLGFDHDYLANRGVDQHFYEGNTRPGSKTELVPLADRIPYDEEMLSLLNLWKNYRSLHRIAKEKGIKIYNATKGGFLDVFERIDFEKLQNFNSQNDKNNA